MLQSGSLEMNANFELTMDESAVLTLLPASQHGGNLFLSYSTNDPVFIASTLRVYGFGYHYFGVCVAVLLLALCAVKGAVLDPNGSDKGQIAAHILLLKTPVLALYPTYAELLDYCAGFMFADLPWLNNAFADRLSDASDASPAPFRLFYASLSLSSTFLFALITIAAITVVLATIAYLSVDSRTTVRNVALALYNFFLGGICFAAVVSVQGAVLNSMASFSVVSLFYLLGIVLFVCVLGEALWSLRKDVQNLFKLRVIAKCVLLSVLHYSPISLFSLVVCC